jgi:hypothetical protein
MTAAPNYEEADVVLTTIGKKLEELRDSKHLPIDRPIELWRWDEPGVTLTWMETIDGEYICKNIHALIAGDRVEVEINAWSDKDVGPVAKHVSVIGGTPTLMLAIYPKGR